MKLSTMLIAAGLMCMAPAVFAETTAPTGTHDTNVHHTEKKEHKKNRMAKGKKTKPLTPSEKRELDNMQQTTTPPTGTAPEKVEVK